MKSIEEWTKQFAIQKEKRIEQRRKEQLLEESIKKQKFKEKQRIRRLKKIREKRKIKRLYEECIKYYYHENKENNIEQQKTWEQNRKEFRKDYKIEFCLKDKEKRCLRNRENINRWVKKRRKTDINFKLRCDLRSRVLSALKSNKKSASTMELLGCSVQFAREHLESQFTERMTWNNHGTGHHGKGMQEWHIDHIKPCASFDLSKPEEQRKCFHYTNLQPLWATHNLLKSDNFKEGVNMYKPLPVELKDGIGQ